MALGSSSRIARFAVQSVKFIASIESGAQLLVSVSDITTIVAVVEDISDTELSAILESLNPKKSVFCSYFPAVWLSDRAEFSVFVNGFRTAAKK